ncbi:hypothetical protein [Bradyrhizobium sp.]|uniref:hypothetical protein n=1 Tax=Bradyrhizobium sp. TaxID=376 RepID=UPI00262E7F95|nr:hypothetical protein [Bradyrhizobium sp.]
MAEEIVASRFKAQVGYGDTSSLQGSSLLPAEKPKYFPTAAKRRPVAPVDVKASMVNTNRTISAAPIKPAHGMRNVNANPAKIPSDSNRAVQQIAPRGEARR